MSERPALHRSISLADFQAFLLALRRTYQFCRIEGLKATGGKLAIAERVSHYLKAGHKLVFPPSKTARKISTFDWYLMPLALKTMITDN